MRQPVMAYSFDKLKHEIKRFLISGIWDALKNRASSYTRKSYGSSVITQKTCSSADTANARTSFSESTVPVGFPGEHSTTAFVFGLIARSNAFISNAQPRVSSNRTYTGDASTSIVCVMCEGKHGERRITSSPESAIVIIALAIASIAPIVT